jgi:hypothetical protein
MINKKIVNDMDVQAFLDGELTGDEQERVRQAIRTNPVLKSRCEQLALQRRLIAAAWAEEESESLH